MEKRIIAASILSVVLILAWGYFTPNLKQHNTTVKQSTSAVKGIKAKKPQIGTAGLIAKTKKTVTARQPIATSKLIRSVKSVSYKGDKTYAEFSIPSGAVSKLNLLNYSYTEKDLKNKINLGNTKNIIRVINFIPQNAGSTIKLVNIKKEKNSVKFIYNLNNRMLLVKDYKFLKGKYLLTNTISIRNLTNKPIEFKGHYVLSAVLKPAYKNPKYIKFAPIIYINKGSLTPKINENKKYSGNISFAGFNSEYFMLTAVAPGNAVLVKKTGESVSFIIPKKVLISPKKTVNFSLNVFAGPKKLSLLTSLGHHLNSTIGFGFFGFFSIILLHILEFFYGFVHNYGFAIILLVLAIRIVFYPLTYIGFKSMKQMQKLTPRINELRSKYKDNKVELNKKIMALYKESRVNPFGGCLPMLLQIPVFYGLYMTLLISIQLRNAPFMLWINNLSAQDPYYILPILMGVTMLISQKMNPVIGDPTQAKMMLILPVVFTFLFIHFPAGLLLYWTVNNILTIAQQYTINRKFA